MGRDFRTMRDRGVFFPRPLAPAFMATIHPSALLRMPEPERREEEFRLLVRDLALIHPQLERCPRKKIIELVPKSKSTL